MRRSVLPLLLLSVLLSSALSACSTLLAPKPKVDNALYLKPVAYADVPGFAADHLASALPALQKSCVRIATKKPDMSFGPKDFAGHYADWQAACRLLPAAADDAGARGYFTANFNAYQVYGAAGPDGLFTGYYEPRLQGSLTKHGAYTVPLYSRPNDLITVNLGDFKPELKGETIVGRVDKQNLVPYYTRAAIEKGALSLQKNEIVWVNNAVDAFFLHIQGSGEVSLDSGEVLHVGFAAQNGRAYTAIGRELIKRGALAKENVSMQNIRAWLEAHPDQAAEVMNINESYVFFRKLDGAGPLGAEGVALTPERSLAVDRKKLPYGAPVFVDAAAPEGANADAARFQQLMVAQDTGGAITGAVRGDVFWGAGEKATRVAGMMKSPGHDYILLPKSVTVPAAFVYTGMHDPQKSFAYNK